MQRLVPTAANISIPILGLGTWKSQPDEIANAVEAAINAGYRHFDTAFNYNTEEYLGTALKKLINSNVVKREELFITTKLPVFGNRARDVERFLKLSLDKLQMDYVDLYLIHMPFALRCDAQDMMPARSADGTVILDFDSNPLDTWKEMEAQVIAGRAKSIGLSNFNAEQLRALHSSAEIKPSVLQIEMHAYNQQPELLETCRNLNVVVTAYSPLGSPSAQSHFQEKYNYLREIPVLLDDPIVNHIAKTIQRTPGQVLLRHLVQKHVVVIPKSVNPNRIIQNANIFDFELSADDMARLNALDKGGHGRIFDFLFFRGVEKHPHYPFINS